MGKQSSLKPLPEDWDRALAVAAHPDDLEYGAASAIARWTSQGKKGNYILVTRGEAGIDSIHPQAAGPLRPTHAVDVTSFLDRGIDSLKQHGVYLENLSSAFNPEAFLRKNAAETGKRLGCRFAVSFEIINI